MTGMKIDEEFVPDRRIEVETDDEENEAEIHCGGEDNDDDETGSDSELISAHDSSFITASQSQNCSSDPWPQTYRQSMDMYTMPLHSMGTLKGASELNLPIRRSFGPTDEQSTLHKPLITETSLDKDQVPISTLPMKFSKTSALRISGLHDLPPPLLEQCSFSQSVLNVDWTSFVGLFSKMRMRRAFTFLHKQYIVSESLSHHFRWYKKLQCVYYCHQSHSIVQCMRKCRRCPSCSLHVSYCYAAINVLCGIGLLSMPYAFKEGGWMCLLLLLLGGGISCYTGILIKLCLERYDGLQTYPDIGQAAFGFVGRICIAMVLYLELFSSCVEYLIMMNDSLSSLFPLAQLDIGGIHLDSHYLCAIISTLVILPTVWLRNLSLLSYISAGGVITLATVILCLLWLGVVDGIEYQPSGTALEVVNVPVAVGLIGFCYGSHSVLPNIYTSMKEPSRFPSVVLISFSIGFVLYTAVGVFGYLMFGEDIKSQFTLNMPPHYLTSKIAAWTVVVTPVTKFALTLTPIAFGIEELLPPSQQSSYAISIIIRTALMFFTLLVALTVPYFGVVMALTGSVLMMLVSVIFPCACYLRLLRGQTTTFEITICSLMIFAGLVSAVVGTYSSLTSVPG